MSPSKPVSTPMALNEKVQVSDDVEKVDATFYRKLILVHWFTSIQGQT